MNKFLKMLFSNKTIKPGDLCSVSEKGLESMPKILSIHNEVTYLGGFSHGDGISTLCSSLYMSEPLFVEHEFLIKKPNQPTKKERAELIQIDTLATLKEISYQLKQFVMMNLVQEEHEETPSSSSENFH